MTRRPGWSVRLKLTLTYTGFVLVGGLGLMAVFALFLRGYRERWQGQSDRVVIAPSGSELFADVAPAAIAMLVFLLVFGLVGGWFLAGHVLAPLGQTTTATQKVAAGELSYRINLPGPDDEIRELADSFDAMLARIEAQVTAQQRFAANASHELRTPLAITRTLLEVAHKDQTREWTELDERLQTVNTRAIDLTEALLVLSRAGQRAFTPEPVDLSLLADESVETLLAMAEKHGVTVNTSTESARVMGSPALLGQLVTNLVHNAIVHNHGEHRCMWVTTGIRGSEAVLTVENTGELLEEQVVATLAEPFQRGTARVSGDQAGVGLGLAIARTITEAHDGQLLLTARPEGGLRATVQLHSM